MAKKALEWIAPKNSPAYQMLITKAGEAGFSESLVRDMLYGLNAHPTLRAFVQICRNLTDILELPLQEWPAQDGGPDFVGWRALCEWIVDNSELLTELMGAEFDVKPQEPGKNPLLRKGVTRHPLYCALWNIQEKSELRGHYSALQAQALYAHFLVVQDTFTLEEYESYDGDRPLLDSPKSAHAMGLTIRELSHAVAEKELLQFDPFVSPTEFGGSVGTYFLKEDDIGESGDILHLDREREKRQKSLRYFAYFIQRAHGKRSWAWRESHGREDGAGGSSGEPGYVDFEAISSGFEITGESGAVGRYVPSVCSPKELHRNLKQDEPPFDDGGGTLFHWEPEDDESDEEDGDQNRSKRHPGTGFLRARNQKRHIAMANQFLPWRYQALTHQEIHNVVGAAMSHLTEKALYSGGQAQIAFEASLAALIVFWTGSSWQKALDLRIQPYTSKQSSHASLCLLTSPRKNFWRVKSVFPEYKTKLKEPEMVVRPRSEHLYLPDLADLGSWAVRLLRARGQTLSPRTQVFKLSARQCKKYFKRLVTQAQESERVTWTKWERVLFDAIERETGDVVDAIAVTGEPHPLAHTKSFYYTPNERSLVTTYLRAAQKLVDLADLGLEVDFDKCFEEAEECSNSVGSRACASKEAVISGVANLKSKVRTAHHYDGWASFAAYHNIYTFYTVQMLGFASGYRAVRTPYIALDEVHERRYVAAISDKDNELRHKTRLGYLPGPVLRQLDYYERHLAVLFSTCDFRLRRSGEIESNPCFFIIESEDRSGTLEVRPSTLESYLDDFLGLPANAHRRFMRTELKEAGCPPDFVNAFMGHASYGEEPWCRYSGLSLSQYRSIMTAYLEPILMELGFEPIASRLTVGVGR